MAPEAPTDTDASQPFVFPAGKALAGFFLAGFLLALLGPMLAAWGYHRDPPEFFAVGSFFLSLSAGVLASYWGARWLIARKGLRALAIAACSIACGCLLLLALLTGWESAWWKIPGLLLLGFSAGLLSTALFHVISAAYQTDPAGTAVRAGIFHGLGCLAVTLMVAGTFYAYTVPSILILMATVPGYFAGVYAKTAFPAAAASVAPSLRQSLRDFRSPAAVLFALVVFFQFGNEWAIAGWLPLLLVRRIGASPKAALLLLALYWFALLAGRLVAVVVFPRVRHGRLLMGSVFAAFFGCLVLYQTNNQFGAGTAVVVLGWGFASIHPLIAERIGRRFPYYHPGFFSGIFSFALIGAMVAPATLGYAAVFLDIGVVMALPLLGTCTVVALTLLIWLEAKVTGR